ncbi:hypothetical protein IM774_11775 [Erysipelotrichaceae bacterium RD49]|nr:hypothetical protein [Erysipelotrichaceae bacterium RD49]
MKRTKDDWLFLIEDQQQSGMTMAEYCRINSIESVKVLVWEPIFSSVMIFLKLLNISGGQNHEKNKR